MCSQCRLLGRPTHCTSTMYFTTLSILSASLLLLPAHVRATTKCYFVDGSEPEDSSFVPCDPDADVSPCCASNKGSRSDICMSSGLCYAQDGNHRGFIFSNGCTDQTGTASKCPHFCPDGSSQSSLSPRALQVIDSCGLFLATTAWGGGSKVPVWNVLQCSPGIYCCRAATDDTNCCSNTTALITTDIGTLLASATTDTASTTGAATVTGATVTGTSSVTAGITQSATDTAAVAECPKDNSAVVGGAVGGALGLALLASLGALGFMIKRWKDRAPSYAAPDYISRGSHVDGQQSKGLQSPQMPYLPAQELASATPVIAHEMYS